MRKKLLKRLVIACLSGLLVTMPILANTGKVSAAGFWELLLYEAAAMAYLNAEFNNINDHGQQKMLMSMKKSTGVLKDDKAQTHLDNIASRLKSTGLIKGNYAIYANPDKDVNAACGLGRVITVNKGSLDKMDDDEMAFMLGHEMGHGEEKHPVEGIQKRLRLGLAVDLYLHNNDNITSNIISGLAANMINAEVFTQKQEWQADNLGFEYAVAAGYNPGGGAAQMTKIRSIYGNMYQHGLVELLNPNDHPKVSARIANFAVHMTDYSFGHVTVKKDKTVEIDHKPVVTLVAAYGHLAEERAYLMAGNLARVYHNNAVGAAYVGDDGAVYIGNQEIVMPADGDICANELAKEINNIIGQ